MAGRLTDETVGPLRDAAVGHWTGGRVGRRRRRTGDVRMWPEIPTPPPRLITIETLIGTETKIQASFGLLYLLINLMSLFDVFFLMRIISHWICYTYVPLPLLSPCYAGPNLHEKKDIMSRGNNFLGMDLSDINKHIFHLSSSMKHNMN